VRYAKGEHHGREATYKRGCRCEPCTAAHARTLARWKAANNAIEDYDEIDHGHLPKSLKSCRHPTWATCPKCRPDHYPPLPVDGRLLV
jgi:hypothetical protein